MNAENLRRYNLTVEQGDEIDKDYIKKEEVEDFIVNTGFFYLTSHEDPFRKGGDELV